MKDQQMSVYMSLSKCELSHMKTGNQYWDRASCLPRKLACLAKKVMNMSATFGSMNVLSLVPQICCDYYPCENFTS